MSTRTLRLGLAVTALVVATGCAAQPPVNSAAGAGSYAVARSTAASPASPTSAGRTAQKSSVASHANLSGSGLTTGARSVSADQDRDPHVRQDGTYIFPGVGAEFTSVTTPTHPRFTRAQAEQRFNSDAGPAVKKGTPPTAVRLVMYMNRFGKMQPSGPDIPSVPRQLAWLSIHENVPVGPSSRPGGSSLAPLPPLGSTAPATATCTAYTAISADTGRYLDGFRFCFDTATASPSVRQAFAIPPGQ